MATSKKDYEAIAAILNSQVVELRVCNPLAVQHVYDITKKLGLYFGATNPRFDTARFYATVQK